MREGSLFLFFVCFYQSNIFCKWFQKNIFFLKGVKTMFFFRGIKNIFCGCPIFCLVVQKKGIEFLKILWEDYFFYFFFKLIFLKKKLYFKLFFEWIQLWGMSQKKGGGGRRREDQWEACNWSYDVRANKRHNKKNCTQWRKHPDRQTSGHGDLMTLQVTLSVLFWLNGPENLYMTPCNGSAFQTYACNKV